MSAGGERASSRAREAAEGAAAPAALAAHTLADVVGHWQAKRALIIAAAGGHSLLMVGPPGSGKSRILSAGVFIADIGTFAEMNDRLTGMDSTLGVAARTDAQAASVSAASTQRTSPRARPRGAEVR